MAGQVLLDQRTAGSADDRRRLLAFARDLLNSDYAGHRLTFQLFAQSPPFAHLAAVYRNFDWDGSLEIVQASAGLSDRVLRRRRAAMTAHRAHPALQHRATPTPSRSSTTTSARPSSPATRCTCAARSAQDLDTRESVGIGDVEAQAEKAMANIELLLEEAGAKLEDIVKIVVYLTDIRYREPVYRVMGRWLKGVFPVSTGLVVTALARPEWVVEIDATAVIPEDRR